MTCIVWTICTVLYVHSNELKQIGKHRDIVLPQIEVLEFLKAAYLSGKLFYLIVEHIQHLQILEVSNVWRYSYQREKHRKCSNTALMS